MAENDIELNIGINASHFEKQIQRVLKKTDVKSPFSSFGKEKTQVGKVHLDPLNKLGKLWKLDLYWKWLKGTWATITKYIPLIGKLSDLFSAAISLVLTALLLPFLPDILDILTSLLKSSAEFFKWSKTNSDKIRGGAQLGFEALLAGLGLSGIVKVFTYLATEILPKVIPGFKLLADVLQPVVAWLGEKGLGKVLGGLVTFLAKFIDPLLWATLIADISSHIFGWIQSWSNNPIWQAFWGGMSELAKIVSELTDVFGWLIDIITGKLGNRINKIGDEIADFGAGIKNALGFSGSIAGGNLRKMADGGIVTSPTPALVGEAGPEAVIPLDQMKGMGGTSITVNGIVDEYKFRSIIKEEIEKSNRRLSNVRGAVSI